MKKLLVFFLVSLFFLPHPRVQAEEIHLGERWDRHLREDAVDIFTVNLTEGIYQIKTRTSWDMDLVIEVTDDSTFTSILYTADKKGLEGNEKCRFRLFNETLIYVRVSCSRGSGFYDIIIKQHLLPGLTIFWTIVVELLTIAIGIGIASSFYNRYYRNFDPTQYFLAALSLISCISILPILAIFIYTPGALWGLLAIGLIFLMSIFITLLKVRLNIKPKDLGRILIAPFQLLLKGINSVLNTVMKPLFSSGSAKNRQRTRKTSVSSSSADTRRINEATIKQFKGLIKMQKQVNLKEASKILGISKNELKRMILELAADDVITGKLKRNKLIIEEGVENFISYLDKTFEGWDTIKSEKN